MKKTSISLVSNHMQKRSRKFYIHDCCYLSFSICNLIDLWLVYVHVVYLQASSLIHTLVTTMLVKTFKSKLSIYCLEIFRYLPEGNIMLISHNDMFCCLRNSISQPYYCSAWPIVSILFLAGGPLDFYLYKNEQPNGYLKIISFDSKNITIMFNVRSMGDDKKCKLNDIEQLSRENAQEWNSVKHLLGDVHCFELDDDDIEQTYTWLPLSYEGWMKLRLKVSWFSRITGCIYLMNSLVNPL